MRKHPSLLDAMPELKAVTDRRQEAQVRFKELLDTGLEAEAAAGGALAGGATPPLEDVDPIRDAIRLALIVDTDPVIQARLRELEATPVEEGVWDAFREAGMAKIANAALKEHGWMLVYNLAGETIPMRLPGPPRIARAEDLEAEDVKHLERLAKLSVE